MTYRQFIRTIIYERKHTVEPSLAEQEGGWKGFIKAAEIPKKEVTETTETREIAVNQWGHDYIKGTDHVKNFADSGWTIVSEGEPQIRTLSVNEDNMFAKDVIIQADGSQSIRYHGNGRCMTLHGVRYSGGNTLFDYMVVS